GLLFTAPLAAEGVELAAGSQLLRTPWGFRLLTGISLGGGAAATKANYDPAQIARELVAANNGSARAAIDALNKLSLPQNKVAEILTEVFQQTGRAIGGTQLQPNGTLLLLSRVIGTKQPIIGVSPQGKAVFGCADLVLINEPPFVQATNVSFPTAL